MYGGRNDEDGSFSAVECYDTGICLYTHMHVCMFLLIHRVC